MGENKELATEVKIHFGYLLRVQRPASVYLFDTLCPGYWGDDLSCDRQYLGTRSQPGEWRVSASHLGLWAHSFRQGLYCQQTMSAELRGNWPHRRHVNKHTFRQITLRYFPWLGSCWAAGNGLPLPKSKMILWEHRSEVSYVVRHYWGLGQV